MTRRICRIVRRSILTPTGVIRPWPDFLIIGAQKAGTTMLYEYLVMHPRVVPAHAKEVHYFDNNAFRSSAWYRSHFAWRGRHMRQKLTGEATPYYLFHPFVAERAAALVPSVRVVVLLREPVARALSHHNHVRALGLEHLPLAEALDAEEERLVGEEERLADPRCQSSAHQHHSYLARGRYAEQLRRWFAQFPREQILVLASESLFVDSVATYRRVLDFLGLPAFDPGLMLARNARSYDRRAPVELRERLERYFAPHNDDLRDLLGEDLGWCRATARPRGQE